jgi:hypothetical protein
VDEVLNFAQGLCQRDLEWRRFGQEQLARFYGDDEPEYTIEDVKGEPIP